MSGFVGMGWMCYHCRLLGSSCVVVCNEINVSYILILKKKKRKRFNFDAPAFLTDVTKLFF